MKQWWQSLAVREQQLFSLGAVVLLLGVLYWGVWSPLQQAQQSREQQLSSQRQTLTWAMRQGEVLISQRGQSARPDKVNVNQAVSTSARQQRIVISRIQPRSNEVEVWIEDVPFTRFINWLKILDQRYGIQVDSVDMEALDKPGMVNIRRLKLSTLS